MDDTLKESDINHYTSMSTKRTKKWYIPTVKHYVETCLKDSNAEESISNLNAANGVYDKETIDTFLSLINSKTYVDEVKDLNILDDIDLVVPITRRIIGEFIRQPDNDYTCTLDDPDTTLAVNQKASAKVETMLMKQLINILQNTEKENLKNIDFDEELNKLKAEYYNKEAGKSKAFVDSVVNKTGLVNDLIQQFYYFYSCERVFTLIDTSNDSVELTHIPPYEYYRYPSSPTCTTEEDVAGLHRFHMGYYEFKSKFGDVISKDELEYLEEVYSNDISEYSKNATILNYVADMHSMYNSKVTSGSIGGIFNDGHNNTFRNESNILVNRLIHRTKRKYGTLTIITPEGLPTTVVVDDTYKLNTAAGDISIEWEWHDVVLESYIFGDVDTGVYTKPKVISYQREILEGVKTVYLPVVGDSGLLLNYVHRPIPKRLKPLNILYKYLYQKILSEISKFNSYVNVIPESLLTSSREFSVKERLQNMYQDNTLIIDDSQASANSLQALRSIGNSQHEYIAKLVEIKDMIKADAWEIADMNNERYGDIDTRGGQGNTREAIIRISTGTLLLFVQFDNYLERLYQAISDYARLVYTSGVNFEFISDTGTVEHVNMNHDKLMSIELGIKFKKAQIEKEKVDIIRNNVVQAAMQNNQFLLGIEAIDSENVSKIKDIAKSIDTANKEREQYMSQLQAQIDQMKIEREREEDENEYKLKTDVEHIKGNYGLLEKDKDLMMKMIEFSSFNPDDTQYKDDIDILGKEIDKAELELKRSQNDLLKAKISETKAKTNAAKTESKKSTK